MQGKAHPTVDPKREGDQSGSENPGTGKPKSGNREVKIREPGSQKPKSGKKVKIGEGGKSVEN